MEKKTDKFYKLAIEIKKQLEREDIDKWNLDFIAGRMSYMILEFLKKK